MNKIMSQITPDHWWPPPLPNAIVSVLPDFLRRHLIAHTFRVHNKLPGQTQHDLETLLSHGMSMRVVNILYNSYIQLLVSENMLMDGVLRYSSFCVGLDFPDTTLTRRLFSLGDRRNVDELNFADFALLCWKVCACAPKDLGKLAFQLFDSDRGNQMYNDDGRLMIIALVGKARITQKGYIQRLTKELIQNNEIAVPYASVMRFLDVHQTLLRPLWGVQGQLQRSVGHRRLWKAQTLVRTKVEERIKARRRSSLAGLDDADDIHGVVKKNSNKIKKQDKGTVYGLSGGGGEVTTTLAAVSPFKGRRKFQVRARRSSAPDIGTQDNFDAKGDGVLVQRTKGGVASMDEVKDIDNWLHLHNYTSESEGQEENEYDPRAAKKPLSALPGRSSRAAAQHRHNRLAPVRGRRASVSILPSSKEPLLAAERRISIGERMEPNARKSEIENILKNIRGNGLPRGEQAGVRRFSAPDASLTAVAMARRQKMKEELAQRRKKRRTSSAGL